MNNVLGWEAVKKWSFVSILVHGGLFIFTLIVVYQSMNEDASLFFRKVFEFIQDEPTRNEFVKTSSWVVWVLSLFVFAYFFKFYISLILFDESTDFRDEFLAPLPRWRRVIEVIQRSCGFLFLLIVMERDPERILNNIPVLSRALSWFISQFLDLHKVQKECLGLFSLSVFMVAFFAWWLLWDLNLLLSGKRERNRQILSKYISVHVLGLVGWLMLGFLCRRIAGHSEFVIWIAFVIAFITTQFGFTVADLVRRRRNRPSPLRETLNVLKDNLSYLRVPHKEFNAN